MRLRSGLEALGHRGRRQPSRTSSAPFRRYRHVRNVTPLCRATNSSIKGQARGRAGVGGEESKLLYPPLRLPTWGERRGGSGLADLEALAA